MCFNYRKYRLMFFLILSPKVCLLWRSMWTLRTRVFTSPETKRQRLSVTSWPSTPVTASASSSVSTFWLRRASTQDDTIGRWRWAPALSGTWAWRRRRWTGTPGSSWAPRTVTGPCGCATEASTGPERSRGQGCRSAVRRRGSAFT